MAESRKEWATPEMTVLVRTKTEEAVLTACKGQGDTSGPGSSNNECDYIVCINSCDANVAT